MSVARTFALGRVAGGNHLTADCDEPERPVFTEAELIAADLARNVDKAQRRVDRDVQAGIEDQVQHLRQIGGL